MRFGQRIFAHILEFKSGGFAILSEYVRMKFYFPLLYCRRLWIPGLDVHVVNRCNLNCKSCSTFSPLGEEWFYDASQAEKDFRELSRKVQISFLSFIGGEPLLHPNLVELIQIASHFYPKASLSIVTNGCLLLKMRDVFWEICREKKVMLRVSVYPPFQRSLVACFELAKNRGVDIFPAENFRAWKRGSVSFRQDGGDLGIRNFRRCSQKVCHKLWNSKLYLCPMCFFQHYNRYFNESHPTVKGYDIYKHSGKELVQFMKRPDPACRYCTWVMKNETTQWDYSKREKSEWCEDV